MLGIAAPFADAALGGKMRFSWRTDSIAFVAMRSSGLVLVCPGKLKRRRGAPARVLPFSADGSTNSCRCKDARWRVPRRVAAGLHNAYNSPTAGLPALHGSEPGQVRKEAA